MIHLVNILLRTHCFEKMVAMRGDSVEHESKLRGKQIRYNAMQQIQQRHTKVKK